MKFFKRLLQFLCIGILISCEDWDLKKQDYTVTDIDGNVYHTVKIGTQTWMVENLKTTRYRNGDTIPNVTDNTAWYNLTTGAYCNHSNNASIATTYGRLYNWHAVNDSRKIAPVGWHVPSDNDWIILVNYLGGSIVAGGKLKEAGTAHWNSPNSGANNSSGFTALPGGFRVQNGTFYGPGNEAYLWSATEADALNAKDFYLHYNGADAGHGNTDKENGLSVRCVKD